MAEQGGYSGPQLFERTVALVKRYRKTLDDGMQSQPDPVSAPTQEQKSPGGSSNQVADGIEATVRRDRKHLEDSTERAENDSKLQPLIRLPERNDPFSSETSDPTFTDSSQVPQTQSSAPSESSLSPSLSPAASPQNLNAEAPKRKVIFASGGITNERQVQEVLAAGSSIALLYTALVYGGVGTVSSIKSGLNEEIKRAGRNRGVQRTR